MDAVDFLKEWRRICRSNTSCDECDLTNDCGRGISIDSYSNDEIECITSSVEQWVKEHPIKTSQSEFLKMFPNAKLSLGVLDINSCEIDSTIKCQCNGKCHTCRRDYWLQALEARNGDQ